MRVAVFHQWLPEYCPLKRQLSLSCRQNTYLWRHPTNNSPTVTNLFSEVAKWYQLCTWLCDIQKQSTKHRVLLKPNIANILLFNFREQKFVQHGPITIAIDCNGLSLLIFEEKWPNYASRPKSAPNSDSFWALWLFNVCLRVFCAPNTMQFCLFAYPPRSKWASFEKMIIFFAKIGIFCMSIAGPLSEAKTHWMVNWLQLLNQLNIVWRYTKVFM